MTRKIYDTHLHSDNSADAHDPVAVICREAAERGLDGITFTDHVDIHLGRETLTRRVERMSREIADAAREFAGRLEVRFGMELGEANHDPSLAAELASAPGLDFVLGSLHEMRGEPDFCRIDYRARDMDDLITRYCGELYEIADSADFDSMAHINYIIRYMDKEMHDSIDFRPHYDELEPVLRRLAERGKALEMNMSVGKRYGDVVPSADVFRMFHDAGGELVTIGTDAHRSSDVGGRVGEAQDILASYGFRYFALYEGRRPSMIKI